MQQNTAHIHTAEGVQATYLLKHKSVNKCAPYPPFLLLETVAEAFSVAEAFGVAEAFSVVEAFSVTEAFISVWRATSTAQPERTLPTFPLFAHCFAGCTAWRAARPNTSLSLPCVSITC